MDQFMPHGFCMRWDAPLLFTHVASDILIALAYFSIPLALLTFVRKRKDVKFSFMFWLFSAFIFSCGLTHLAAILTIWQPDYWLEGLLKATTAIVSVATAILLWPTIPKALKIPSPDDLNHTNEALSRTLQRLELSTMSSGVAIWNLDLVNNRIECDEQMYRYYEITREDAEREGRNAWRKQVHPEDIPILDRGLNHCIETGEPFHAEFRIMRSNGKIRYLRAHGILQKDKDGKPLRILGTNIETTELQETLHRLATSEAQFRSAVEYSAIGKAIVGLDGRWLMVNRALCHILGYSKDELQTKTFQDITHPEDLEVDLNNMKSILTGIIDHYHIEKRYYHKSGTVIHALLSVACVRDPRGRPLHFISQIQDITKRKLAEEQLIKSVQEKEALLKEIHHRVKNNMQVVSSLLQLQSSYLHDERDKEIFADCQNRIRIMASVHERLYRSDNLSSINFGEHLEGILDLLISSQKGGEASIRVEKKISPVTLDIDTSIPLGLIANEILSNCLKHAFPDRNEGLISVLLEEQDPQKIHLRIRDDGQGFPKGMEVKDLKSLGMRLVTNLSRQIRAEVKIENHQGTSIELFIPKKLPLG